MRDLEAFYDDILEALDTAALCLPAQNVCRRENRVVGWNTYCKELYGIAREKYLIWHAGGRVRNGIIFDEMKFARTSFKNALNYCKKNELKIRKENLLNKFKWKNKTQFWRDVAKIKGNVFNSCAQIDGKSDVLEIN